LRSALKDLKTASFGLLLRLALTAFAFWMVWLDIAVYQTQILEISFTEVTQEAMLFVCALLFWLSPAAEGQKGFNMLAGGFFACLLTRELDGLMDSISHSAWCWPFMLIAITTIAMAFNRKNRVCTLETLAAFTRTPAFGALSTALCVLVFSRVFGMGSLWHLILDDGYARLAKTTVEEGIELMAYAMWLAASLEYYLKQRTASVRVPTDHAARPRHVEMGSRI
jgi:heme/copper-type cytochrome/quinol oxidase subunit 4